jgi:hypothetical protein
MRNPAQKYHFHYFEKHATIWEPATSLDRVKLGGGENLGQTPLQFTSDSD